jgi:hypothetical protein
LYEIAIEKKKNKIDLVRNTIVKRDSLNARDEMEIRDQLQFVKMLSTELELIKKEAAQ